MPQRVQLSRRKGWRMPENTVKVDRSTKWGNHFVIGKDPAQLAHYADYRRNVDLWTCWPVADAATAVRAFREMQCTKTFVERAQRDLRGKNLACWCKPGEPCHADVLLELANAPRCEEIKP